MAHGLDAVKQQMREDRVKRLPGDIERTQAAVGRDLSQWCLHDGWTVREAGFLLANLDPADHPHGIPIVLQGSATDYLITTSACDRSKIDEYHRRFNAATEIRALLQLAVEVELLRVFGKSGMGDSWQVLKRMDVIEWAHVKGIVVPSDLDKSLKCVSGPRESLGEDSFDLGDGNYRNGDNDATIRALVNRLKIAAVAYQALVCVVLGRPTPPPGIPSESLDGLFTQRDDTEALISVLSEEAGQIFGFRDDSNQSLGPHRGFGEGVIRSTLEALVDGPEGVDAMLSGLAEERAKRKARIAR